jgi:hypothetical protein
MIWVVILPPQIIWEEVPHVKSLRGEWIFFLSLLEDPGQKAGGLRTESRKT